ncbi:hypothetical protein [Streptomyces sp. YIM S03343]
MLTIEVKRHPQGQPYFTPWIEYEGGDRCTFHLHWDDVTAEGVDVLRQLFTELARRWHPRPPGAPRGRIVPVIMERKTVMPDGVTIAVDDLEDGIVYTLRADLLSERGAAGLGRAQTDISPGWTRYPPGHWDMGTV